VGREVGQLTFGPYEFNLVRTADPSRKGHGNSLYYVPGASTIATFLGNSSVAEDWMAPTPAESSGVGVLAYAADVSGVLSLLLALPGTWVAERLAAGGPWCDYDLVFCTRTGGALDAANVRREFKAVCRAAKIGGRWAARELRHSFVSLMSSSGVPVEAIARLAGHANTRTTEVVYRRELRPVLTTGAEAMDRLFPSSPVPG
jgi:hypothetical protein